MPNVSEEYGWYSAEPSGASEYITPKVLEALALLHAKRVCDLGSGNGALCGALVREGYYASGVECALKGFLIAKQNLPGINFYNLSVQDDPANVLASETEPFDAVVSTEVVEHLFSPHCLPVFARKLLRKGGHLVISTPYHGFLKNLALSVFNKWDFHHAALWHGGHIKFWSRKTLTQLLEKNGFQVLTFWGVGGSPFFWKSMILIAKAV